MILESLHLYDKNLVLLLVLIEFFIKSSSDKDKFSSYFVTTLLKPFKVTISYFWSVDRITFKLM